MRDKVVRAVAVAGACAVALVLSGCAEGGARSSEGGFVTGDGAVTVLEPQDRPEAPVVSGPELGNPDSTISTDSYTEDITVLNVWGSWCGPCRAEAPELEKAAEQTEGTAAFLGLNTRDLDEAPAVAFTRNFDVSYPSIYDPSGSLLLEFSDQLPPSGIPSTLVIDSEGRVAARIIGETTATTLVGVIEDVAADT